MSEKCMKNAAFSNIQNLFSEPVNTICFAMKHGQRWWDEHCLPTKTNTRRADEWNSMAVIFPSPKHNICIINIFIGGEKMAGNALSLKENFFQSNLLLLENTNKQRIPTVFPSVNRTVKKENCWLMERITQFVDSKITGKLWILLSENVRKFRTCFPNRWTPCVLQWSTHTHKIMK